MSDAPDSKEEAADRMVEWLSGNEMATPSSLHDPASQALAIEAERLAAAYALGRLPKLEALPAGLERRLRRRAEGFAAASRPTKRWSFADLFRDWQMPALCASIAALSFVAARILPTDVDVIPRSIRAEHVATYAWGSGTDSSGAAVKGYVAWQPGPNQGYMVFKGLKPNDPTREQYQLWIIDADRDARYPVDGGVFDMPASGGEVRIAINPRLHVSRPAAFVVTVERPGGVVVSDRGRIAAIAKVEKG